MQNLQKSIAFLALLLVFGAVHSRAAFAKLNIMPAAEVKAGMKGEGRTVFLGSKVESFPIEVLGVIPGSAPGGGPMILVRTSGPLIENNGGVALGMSGSPIYINGKLVGALSTAFPESDHMLAGITSIEDMISSYDFIEKKKAEINPPINTGGKTYSMLDYTGGEQGANVLHARTALAPVLIRGLDARSYKYLSKFFKDSGVDTLPMEGMPAGKSVDEDMIGSGKTLQPGSSIAVELVRGDVDISAVGTVTAIDGDKVLAFGHPFFRKGKVEFVMADAPVITVLKGKVVPYKITNTGIARGMISQDRGSAVVGQIDKFPMMIPLKVVVEDSDITRSKTYSVKIVKDDDMLTQMIVSVLVQAIDNTIDRFGPGTATMDFKLTAEGIKQPIARTNMFYSSYDISAESLMELLTALSILKENNLQKANISGLEMHLKINSSHATAAIVEAELFDPKTGKPLPEFNPETGKESVGGSLQGGADKAEPAPAEAAPAADDLDIPDEGDVAPAPDEGGDSAAPAPNEAPSPGDDLIDEDDSGPDPGGDVDGPDSGDNGNDNSIGDDGGNDSIDPPAPAKAPAPSDSRRPKRANVRKNSKKKILKIVHPGEKIGVKVMVRPYQKEPVEEKIFIKVPKDIPEGTAVVQVYSGMKYMYSMYGPSSIFANILSEEFAEPEHGLKGSREGKKKKETLEDIIKKYLERDKNNDLIATVTSMSAQPADESDDEEDIADESTGPSEGDDSSFDEPDIEAPPKDRSKKATDWVIFGGSSVRIKVVDEKGGVKTLKTGKIEKSKIKALEHNGDAGGESGGDDESGK